MQTFSPFVTETLAVTLLHSSSQAKQQTAPRQAVHTILTGSNVSWSQSRRQASLNRLEMPAWRFQNLTLQGRSNAPGGAARIGKQAEDRLPGGGGVENDSFEAQPCGKRVASAACSQRGHNRVWKGAAVLSSTVSLAAALHCWGNPSSLSERTSFTGSLVPDTRQPCRIIISKSLTNAATRIRQ